MLFPNLEFTPVFAADGVFVPGAALFLLPKAPLMLRTPPSFSKGDPT